jgi:hypothetical protein
MSWRVLGQTLLMVLPVIIVCTVYADEPVWRLVLTALAVGAVWGLLISLSRIYLLRRGSTGRPD